MVTLTLSMLLSSMQQLLKYITWSEMNKEERPYSIMVYICTYMYIFIHIVYEHAHRRIIVKHTSIFTWRHNTQNKY